MLQPPPPASLASSPPSPPPLPLIIDPSAPPPPPPPPGLPFLLLLLLLSSSLSLHGARGLGSMATLAASYDGLGGALLCGIMPGPLQGILCWNSSDGSVSQVSPLQLSFAGLTGGRGFFCALRRDTSRPLCWNHTSLASPKRLDDDAFSDIAAGDSHVCALSAGAGHVACWRGGPPPDGRQGNSSGVPFSHLASGSDFVCGLRSADGTAVCWGNPGVVPPNVSFQSLQAGSSHACGLTYTFNVQCWGDNSHDQLAAPLGKQFLSLALGRRHSCGIEAFSRNVFCWGASSGSSPRHGGSSPHGYPPSSSLTFSTIVAGDDFTCGILFNNFSVFCWSASSSLPAGTTFLPSLYRIIPSACTSLPCPDKSFRSRRRRRHLCSDPDAYVCTQCRIGCQGLSLQTQPCTAEQDISCSSSSQPMIPPPNTGGGAPPPVAASSFIVFRSKRSRVSLLLLAFGACGTACGLVTVAWCLWAKLFRHRYGGSSNMASAGGGRVASSILMASSSKSMMRRQRSSTSSAAAYRGNREGKAQAFSIEEMEAATMGFAEEMRIGAGSFGVVYRGTLSDGRAVAIKRGEKEAMNNNERKLKEKESAFQSELEFLSRLHHKHLVSLVGYCDEEDERMLVYDYMPNGTLHDHLHGRIKGGGGSAPVAAPPLPWQMRIKIALEAARGVEYLHKYALPPIIHRDIKSSNILLDSHWNARVSDFGLSTHGPIEKSHLSLMAAGTLGYMDPEYYRHQHLTIKSDVYSFGVVLLELLTGERAIHKQSHGPVNIVDFTVPRIAAGDLASLLDRRAAAASERERVALEMIAQLAIKCVRLELKERPTMSEIVGVLEEAMAFVKEGSSVSEAAAEECASEAASEEAMMGRGLSETFAEEMDGEGYGGRGEEVEMVSPAAMSVMVSPAAPEAEEV